MSIKETLKPFMKRLKTEALIRSAVLAGMIAACIACCMGIVHVIIPWLINELMIILIFFGLFAVAFALVFLLRYCPSNRDVARRLDSLGMSERVETMLEFEHSAAPAVRLQREDTLGRLQSIQPELLRLRISKLLSVLCALFVICATVLLFIPEVNAFSRHPIINDLGEMVEDSYISDEFREDLEQIMEDLEEMLEQSENDRDKEQAMEDAMGQIDESVKKENSHEDLGGALQNYNDLRELGEALQNGDKEGVSSALDQLREEMTDNPEKQESVADQLQNALENSGVDPENDLYEALENMKDGLKKPDQPLEETMDKAESEISDALDKQQNAENLGEQMKEELENAKPSNPDGEDSGEQGEQGQNGSQNKEEQPGQSDQQGGSSGGSEGSSGDNQTGVGNEGAGGNTSSDANMKDKIVDPDAGQVNYGSVYAGYVADFLEKAEGGKIPDSVAEAMNEYLEQLKDQNDRNNGRN